MIALRRPVCAIQVRSGRQTISPNTCGARYPPNMKFKHVCVLLAGTVLLWGAYLVGLRWWFGSWSDAGAFGDAFGALNTLFTGLAFIVVFATLLQQAEQIETTRKDLAAEHAPERTDGRVCKETSRSAFRSGETHCAHRTDSSLRSPNLCRLERTRRPVKEGAAHAPSPLGRGSSVARRLTRRRCGHKALMEGRWPERASAQQGAAVYKPPP